MSEPGPAMTESPAEQNAESVTPFAAPVKSAARLAGEAQAELRQVQYELTSVNETLYRAPLPLTQGEK